ncbi:hypothetical protein SOHN41_00659 [Shewanella sp. HN-41]|nr:hypothetical protein SOHN41_00659 [Shewanella sp. HN-41]
MQHKLMGGHKRGFKDHFNADLPLNANSCPDHLQLKAAI